MLTHRLSPYSEERRLVTVLFADFTGFTALAETLDPEEIGDLLNRLWTPLDAIVVQHGGRVDKHVGDSLMAVWGAPRATEEDTERAVLCALALQKKLEALNAEWIKTRYAELQMHIGINTGSVVTTFIDSTGEYSVVGDVVNTAQRLQMIAPAGSVVIGPGTYRLVREAFRLQHLPPQELKGKTTPVEAFLVLSPEIRPVRARYRVVSSLDVHLVGREAELARLREDFEQVQATRRPQMILLTSEAGVGKSRLLFEFSRRLELGPQRALMLSSRALPEITNLPFGLWEALWANWLGMLKDEPESVRRDKFAQGIREVWGKALGPVHSAEAIHVLGYLAGLDWRNSPFLAPLRSNPDALLARSVELATELFRRGAATGPVILLLDDVHHADAHSLDLFEALLDQQDLPLLIVSSSRLAPESLRPSWRGHDNFEHLALGPVEFTQETVAAMFPRAATLPESLRQRLAARADGNPYFLEEMVKSLFQAGIIVSREQGWYLSTERAPDDIPLPDSLRAQLQARLDALGPKGRGVALAASVVGRVFWSGAVVALLRQMSVTSLLPPPSPEDWSATLEEALYELQRQELVFERRESTFVGEREFIFKHNLLREAAYDLMPRKYRRPYHGLVATWFANRPMPEYALAAANHYALAEETARAVHYYRLAAGYLQKRGYAREAQAAAAAADRYAPAPSN